MKTIEFYGGMPLLTLCPDDMINLRERRTYRRKGHFGRAAEIKSVNAMANIHIDTILSDLEGEQGLTVSILSTVSALRELKPRMSPFLRPDTLEEVGRSEEEQASDGQKAVLVSCHGVLLMLLFQLLAEYLLRVDSSEFGQQQPLEMLMPQEYRWTVENIIHEFDNNWYHLSRNRRVEKKPDLWCVIAQARAMLHVAVARAYVVVGKKIDAELWDMGTKSPHSATSRRESIEQSLNAARDVARWCFFHNSKCSSRAKNGGLAWQDAFYPLLEVVQEGVKAWSAGEPHSELLFTPVFIGPCNVSVRKLHTHLDTEVEYSYELERQHKLIDRWKKSQSRRFAIKPVGNVMDQYIANCVAAGKLIRAPKKSMVDCERCGVVKYVCACLDGGSKAWYTIKKTISSSVR